MALSKASIDGEALIHDGDFWRIRGRHVAAVRVPVDADTLRPVSQVPPEEIDLAVLGIVRDARVVDGEVVSQAVARLFGWRRQGADIQAAVLAAVSRLLSDGRLVAVGDGLLRTAAGL